MTDAAVLRSSVIIYMRLKDQGCNVKWPRVDGIFRREHHTLRADGDRVTAVVSSVLELLCGGAILGDPCDTRVRR